MIWSNLVAASALIATAAASHPTRGRAGRNDDFVAEPFILRNGAVDISARSRLIPGAAAGYMAQGARNASGRQMHGIFGTIWT